jgi:L-aminopeptidase/D-esterase-like protein
VDEGNVGAGTGASVAKLHGPERAVKGGLGTVSLRDGDLVVGALAAVNALGEILDEDGTVLVGAQPMEEDGGVTPSTLADVRPEEEGRLPGVNTTLVVVATNARLSKERAHLLALAGHEGISAAVRPSHTLWDGDTVFSVATGALDADQRTVEGLAARAVALAIRRGVLLAESVPGCPAGRPA